MPVNHVTIDINYACGLACEFCYSTTKGNMTLEKMTEILDEYPDADVFEIGGGEPFLHRDFFHFLETLASRNKKIHIATSATRVPERFFEFQRKDLVTVQVSMHAAAPEAYKAVTGRDEFVRVIDNIRKIKPHYSTLISSVIYNDNFLEAEGLLQLGRELDVPMRFNLALPKGDGRYVSLLNRKEIGELRTYLLKAKLRGQDIDSPLLHENTCPALESAYGIALEGTCPAQDGSKAYIDPAGHRFRCEFWK